jgi:excisionase family DNA binding protein
VEKQGQKAPEPLWIIDEAAQYLHVSVAYLRRAVRLNQIPFVRVGTRACRFRRRDLDSWVGRSTPAPAPRRTRGAADKATV